MSTIRTVNEIDDQTLDVRPVHVLVGHDHEVAVPQQLDVAGVVNLIVLEAQYIHEILNLGIAGGLFLVLVAHVHGLALEGKDAVVVASHHATVPPRPATWPSRPP